MRLALPLLVTLLVSSLSAQGSATPRFEVASVRVNTSNPPMQLLPTLQPGGRVFAINMPLRELIRIAYDVQDNQVITTSPLADARFDLEARAGASATKDQAVGMLRTLLAERFKLQTHAETRELPVYTLLRVNSDRLGPRLKPSPTDCASLTFATGPDLPPPPPPPPPASAGTPLLNNRMLARCPTMFFPGGMSVRAMHMGALSVALERIVRRTVYDKTGLQGEFDFDLTYTQDSLDTPVIADGPGISTGGPVPRGPAGQGGPGLFAALREQLGLRLEAGRAQVNVLVVDQMQQPTEN